ncbi:MAG: glycosyltransferase family 1 protein [Cyanobacteria bacterium]|nr:glycosyltransferase family 1 protein [Cyanobacteriota bacterium]MDW8201974.1 glycosyltransferase family 1 protein [Cyanobacteriota bacterium SKYGB_h_bin112]
MPTATTNQPIFVSLIPNLLGGKGHVYAYHCAVREALMQLGWTHQAAVAPDAILKTLPEGWTPALDGPNLEAIASPVAKALNWWGIYRWSEQVANYLRGVVVQGRPVIVLLERFIPSQLIGLWLALARIPTDHVAVWLLYRRDIHRMRIRRLYKLLNQLIAQQLSPDRLQLLSDSELQAKSLMGYFQMPVTVMPIPHTTIEGAQPGATTPKHDIICWWVGEPRPEKGLATIQRLVTLTESVAEQFCLIHAASANIASIPNGMKVKAIADNLSREDYNAWLMASDIILLPYDCNAYQERTSGVFVEGVIAGKLPIVTQNTWMAHELARYGLSELAVVWEQPGILQYIVDRLHDPTVTDRLQRMQQAYLDFHTPATYAKVLLTLYHRSFPSS